jgi:hypothetical protein
MEQYLGKRVLMKYNSATASIVEAKILEVSDNGRYVKVKYLTGSTNIYWLPIKDYEIIDTLSDVNVEDLYGLV